MARSRVRKQAKLKKNAAKNEKIERNKRIKQMESWYNELEGYENQAIANIVDRAAVEEGEADATVSQSGGEDPEGGGGQGGSDGSRDA